MNRKELYINGKLVDLDEANNPIPLTYAINDLAELKDRNAYVSNIFKIPPTPNNLAICGYPNDPTLIQLEPYRKNSAKIVQNGIEIVPNGIAIISKGGYNIEVQVLAGLTGFFDALGDKKITDLDLSAYDHIWNLANVAGSQNNTDGYIYPVIDYGSLSATDRRAQTTELRPATFRKTIIEAIIAEAGYTASGSYQAYEKYNKSLVAFANDKFTHSKAFIDILKTYKVSARKTTLQTIAPPQSETLINLEDDASTDPFNAWDGTVYTAPEYMRVKFTFNYSIDQIRAVVFGSTPENYISIQKLTGGVWADLGGNLTTNTAPPGDRQSFPDQVITFITDVAPGDKFRINVLQQPGPNRLYSELFPGAKLTIEPIPEEVTYGSTVQLAGTLPDFSQKNFFKDFLQNFGLIAIPDNYNKTLLLINMEDVYNNIPNAEDITDKLYNSTDDVDYALSGYGINNYGKYKEDGAVTKGFGDGLMVFNNLTLDNEVTLFTSLFAATLSIIKLGGVEVSQIRKIEDPAKSLELSVKTEPRILLNKILSSTFEFYGPDGAQTVSSISTPTFTGLSYQDLFDENYPELLQMLYRPFAVVKSILLSETDIASIDWTKPVYDKKTANYYYKNKITYMQGDVSKISLVRLAGVPIPEVVPTPDPDPVYIQVALYSGGNDGGGRVFQRIVVKQLGTELVNSSSYINEFITVLKDSPLTVEVISDQAPTQSASIFLRLLKAGVQFYIDTKPSAAGAILSKTFTPDENEVYRIEGYFSIQ